MQFIIVLSALLSTVTAVSGLAIANSNVESRYAVYGSEHVDLVRSLCSRATGESVGRRGRHGHRGRHRVLCCVLL
ncbi:hypothetical protein C8R43DRAFT_1013069, partial [Mycena crocata]